MWKTIQFLVIKGHFIREDKLTRKITELGAFIIYHKTKLKCLFPTFSPTLAHTNKVKYLPIYPIKYFFLLCCNSSGIKKYLEHFHEIGPQLKFKYTRS